MSEGAAKKADLYCPDCRATSPAGSEHCWLCLAELSAVDQSAPRSPSASIADGPSFSLSTLMLLVTMASIGCGLMALFPGFGVLAALVLVPVLIRTSMVVEKRKADGDRVSSDERARLFLTSYAVTSVISIVLLACVCFSAFAAFCVVCSYFDLGHGGGNRTKREFYYLLLGGALLANGLVIILTFYFVRWRYRRDTKTDPDKKLP